MGNQVVDEDGNFYRFFTQFSGDVANEWGKKWIPVAKNCPFRIKVPDLFDCLKPGERIDGINNPF